MVCASLVLASLGCGSSVSAPSGAKADVIQRSSVREKTVPSSAEEWTAQIEGIVTKSSHRIELSQAPITEEQIEQLGALQGVRELLLDEGKINDENVKGLMGRLQGQTLIHLRLRKSPLTDAGLAEIVRAQPSLRILNLPHAQLTAVGMVELAKLQELTMLRLGGRSVDDAAVKAIAKIPNLESLHLIGPSLTDASLESVANMANLRSFYLDDCNLSEAAWSHLFEVRKNIHVHIDQVHHDRDPNRHDPGQ